MAFTTSSLSDSAANQVVAITSVDTVTRRARGLNRRLSEVEIDLRLHVGGLQITPAVGEHWFVNRADTFLYRLISKIPENAPEMSVEAVPGQVQIGSSGPLELHGSQVNVRSPLHLAAYPSADRPAASDFAAGAMIYDTTLHKPLFSDGSSWFDASGGPV